MKFVIGSRRAGKAKSSKEDLQDVGETDPAKRSHIEDRMRDRKMEMMRLTATLKDPWMYMRYEGIFNEISFDDCWCSLTPKSVQIRCKDLQAHVNHETRNVCGGETREAAGRDKKLKCLLLRRHTLQAFFVSISRLLKWYQCRILLQIRWRWYHTAF